MCVGVGIGIGYATAMRLPRATAVALGGSVGFF